MCVFVKREQLNYHFPQMFQFDSRSSELDKKNSSPEIYLSYVSSKCAKLLWEICLKRDKYCPKIKRRNKTTDILMKIFASIIEENAYLL